MKILLALLCAFTTTFAAAPDKSNALPGEALAALKTGTKFVLFSLEPPVTAIKDPEITPEMTRDQVQKEFERFHREMKLNPEEGHHGYKILGSTELADAGMRASAIAAITDAVRDFDGIVAKCFEPRHSLRVRAANGATYDFVVCFECHQVYVFRGKKRIGTAGMTGSQKRLDDLLVAAKIPLAQPTSPK
jgi:hypothetical protein